MKSPRRHAPPVLSAAAAAAAVAFAAFAAFAALSASSSSLGAEAYSYDNPNGIGRPTMGQPMGQPRRTPFRTTTMDGPPRPHEEEGALEPPGGRGGGGRPDLRDRCFRDDLGTSGGSRRRRPIVGGPLGGGESVAGGGGGINNNNRLVRYDPVRVAAGGGGGGPAGGGLGLPSRTRPRSRYDCTDFRSPRTGTNGRRGTDGTRSVVDGGRRKSSYDESTPLWQFSSSSSSSSSFSRDVARPDYHNYYLRALDRLLESSFEDDRRSLERDCNGGGGGGGGNVGRRGGYQYRNAAHRPGSTAGYMQRRHRPSYGRGPPRTESSRQLGRLLKDTHAYDAAPRRYGYGYGNVPRGGGYSGGYYRGSGGAGMDFARRNAAAAVSSFSSSSSGNKFGSGWSYDDYDPRSGAEGGGINNNIGRNGGYRDAAYHPGYNSGHTNTAGYRQPRQPQRQPQQRQQRQQRQPQQRRWTSYNPGPRPESSRQLGRLLEDTNAFPRDDDDDAGRRRRRVYGRDG
eukprot:CAMPEP_0113585862 /NCGR_PEP_ID=MMETSP0015_2-20120614/33958_1 /TAXON_ID=2838 /ORGANISM="Odontella" /LENGTH=509 /DNA_ID=CAMNT_0000491197 /DNA_START=265 /DNA_END=1791 /DNA_ORIENTATION=- /assembly_acc=CAM_ASM_000160